MSPSLTRTLSPLVLSLACIAPAQADITPGDAWGIWQAQARALGLELKADTRAEGERLEVSLLRLSLPLPEEAGTVFLETGGFAFVAADQGAVELLLPDLMTWRMGVSGAGEVLFQSRSGGMRAVMTGDPGRVETRWSWDEIAATLREATAGGEAVELSAYLETGPGQAQVTTEVGQAHLTLQARAQYQGLSYRYGLRDGRVRSTASMRAGRFSSEQDLVLPLAGPDPMALADDLRAGMAITVRFTIGDAVSMQDMGDGGNLAMRQDMRIASESGFFAVTASGLEYDVRMDGWSVETTLPGDAPAIAVAGDAIEVAFAMPLLQDEAAQQASLRLLLENLSLNDEVWAVIDPASRLPHDPATLELALRAQGVMRADLVDVAAVRDIIDTQQPPFLPDSVTLEKLRLSGGGAVLEGWGDLALEADAPDPQASLTGSARFTLSGANRLIDTLVDIGALDDDAVRGLRLTLAMFTRPGEGEDVLVSDIEVQPGLTVIVNGQRLR